MGDAQHVPPVPPFCDSLLTQLLQGIMARVYETSVVLLLLTLLVLGMVWVASAIVGNDAASRQSLHGGCCWGLLGCAGLSLLRDQTLNGSRDLWCHWADPAVSTDLWEYYLPYLYSCISLFGVLLLLCELCLREVEMGSGGAMVHG